MFRSADLSNYRSNAVRASALSKLSRLCRSMTFVPADRAPVCRRIRHRTRWTCAPVPFDSVSSDFTGAWRLSTWNRTVIGAASVRTPPTSCATTSPRTARVTLNALGSLTFSRTTGRAGSSGCAPGPSPSRVAGMAWGVDHPHPAGPIVGNLSNRLLVPARPPVPTMNGHLRSPASRFAVVYDPAEQRIGR